jgi:hypothetical protein
VSRLHVLDTSALVALNEDDDRLMRLYYRALGGELLLGWPASAVFEANETVRAPWVHWHAFVEHPSMVLLPLTVATAVEIADWPGELSARHCVWEARATNGAVVTRKPGGYEGLPVPLLNI